MRIKNWPPLVRTLEHIITHPDQHDQRTYRRVEDNVTARCVAGWLAYFAGYTDDTADYGWLCQDPAGERFHIETAAMISLGFQSDDDSDDYYDISAALFEEDQELDDILNFVDGLAQDDGIDLTPLIVDAMTKAGIR